MSQPHQPLARVKTIKDLPEHSRPREKLQERGASALTDEELVAAILGRGMEGIDVRTMAKHLAGVIREHKEKLALEHLTAVPGIKLAKAAQILSAFELARRYLLRETVKIVCAADVLPLVADSVGQPRRNPLHFWRTRTRSRQDRALSPPRLVRRNRGNHVVLSLTAMSRA